MLTPLSPWLLRFTLPADAVPYFLLGLEEESDLVVAFNEHTSGNLECEIYLPPAEAEAVSAQVPALLAPLAAESGIPFPAYTLTPVEEASWNTPPASSPIPVGRTMLHLIPWQAFGDGSHPTTQGCVRAITDIATRYTPTRSLDVGCGSGVLALAMAACWKQSKILANDIDPVSIQATLANRAYNRLSNIQAFRAAGLYHPRIRQTAPYDLIAANLLANLLLTLAPQFRRRLRKGGKMILSGMLAAQGKRVLARYRAHGFTLQRQYLQDGWLTLVLQRRT